MSYSKIDHTIKAFHTQKDGNSPTEYEDHFISNKENLAFAMADGAADSVFSQQWASLLVDNFTRNPFDIGKTQEVFLNWLEPLQLQWRKEINWKGLRWYVEEKARQGAFSTFLALQIRDSEPDETVDCVAIGDTCLFIIHDDKTTMFPELTPSDFGNTPHLLCSYERYNTKILSNIQTFTRTVGRGDLIIMATDAFAKWLLEDSWDGKRSWTLFQDIDQPEFDRVITGLRESKKIRNDDTTAAFIYLE